MDVRISYASLRGRRDDGKRIHSFLGVPYADPPVGPRRWRPPQPVSQMLGSLDATHFGPVPAQPWQPHQRGVSQTLFFTPSTPQSEDCLTLNIWTPTLDRTARLPVMVWFPGGGFRGGAAASPLYDGSALAAHDVVVVTVNYRVSRFGFLAHPWLTQESPHGSSGNYGLLDQIAALGWVRDEIERFGGDAHAVTIFGQSAGSQSVVYLMSSPLAAGLFHRAIAQSGSPFASRRHAGVLGRSALTLTEAHAEGEVVTPGAATLADLRDTPTDDVLRACPPESFTASRPIIDGWVLPRRPEDTFASGAFNDVPLLCGSNQDEGTIFECQWTAAEHRAFRNKLPPDSAQAYSEIYKHADDGQSRVSATRAYGDRMYAWPVRALAQAHASQSTHGCFLYRFEIVPPCPASAQTDCPVPLGSFHGAELPLVFGSLYPHSWAWTEKHKALSRQLRDVWTGFAKSGSVPGWPRFEAKRSRLTAISEDGFEPRDSQTERDLFWSSLARMDQGSKA